MKQSRHTKIRNLILASSDGMTTNQLAKALGSSYKSMQHTMNNVWGVYVDRWQTVPRKGQYAAVWMCVEVPPDTPYPEDGILLKPQTEWRKP
jgi:hypothetical protein